MYSAATQINNTSDLESAIHTVESDLNLLEDRVEDNENSIGELDHAKDVTSKITIDNDDALVTDGTIRADRLETKYIYSSENSITSPSSASLGYLESTNNGFLFLDSHSTNANIRSTGIYLRSSTTEGVQTFWRIEAHGNTGNLRIYDQLHSRTMIQLRDGNMGVGIGSPTAKLHVDGTLRATGRAHFGADYDNSNANVALFTGTSTNDRVVIQSATGGNAEIRLVSGWGNITSDWGWSANSDGSFGMYQYSNGSSGTRVMSASDDGDIGIGTTEPTAKLDVNGTTRIRGQLTLDTPSQEGHLYRNSNGTVSVESVPDFPDVSHAIDVTNKITVDNDTLVTDDNLTVNGTLRAIGRPHFGAGFDNSNANLGYFVGTSNNDRVVIQSATGGNAVLRLISGYGSNVTSDWGWSANSSGHFGLYQYSNGTSGSWVMTASDEGDIGIGTQNPTARLDVDGLVRMRAGQMVESGSGTALLRTVVMKWSGHWTGSNQQSMGFMPFIPTDVYSISGSGIVGDQWRSLSTPHSSETTDFSVEFSVDMNTGEVHMRKNPNVTFLGVNCVIQCWRNAI